MSMDWDTRVAAEPVFGAWVQRSVVVAKLDSTASATLSATGIISLIPRVAGI